MQLTCQRAIQEHRKMWNWIADESERLCIPVSKHTYLNKYFDGIVVDSDCFLCDYSDTIFHRFYNLIEKACDVCPLQWNGGSGKCHRISGEFSLWNEAYHNGNYIETARLARIIANLPEKEYE